MQSEYSQETCSGHEQVGGEAALASKQCEFLVLLKATAEARNFYYIIQKK